MEIHLHEHKSNYKFIRFTQKCFLDTTMRFYSHVQNFKSSYKNLELITATRLPTVIHHTPTKFYSVI